MPYLTDRMFPEIRSFCPFFLLTTEAMSRLRPTPTYNYAPKNFQSFHDTQDIVPPRSAGTRLHPHPHLPKRTLQSCHHCHPPLEYAPDRKELSCPFYLLQPAWVELLNTRSHVTRGSLKNCTANG